MKKQKNTSLHSSSNTAPRDPSTCPGRISLYQFAGLHLPLSLVTSSSLSPWKHSRPPTRARPLRTFFTSRNGQRHPPLPSPTAPINFFRQGLVAGQHASPAPRGTPPTRHINKLCMKAKAGVVLEELVFPSKPIPWQRQERRRQGFFVTAFFFTMNLPSMSKTCQRC